MRILKIVTLILIAIMTIFAGVWHYVMYSTSNQLMLNYANKKLELNNKKYFFSFSDVSYSGFPFKPNIVLTGCKEEDEYKVIEHNGSFKIGYDLVNSDFSIIYHGDSVSQPKPVIPMFGRSVNIEEISYNIPIKGRISLFKLISQKKYFEIINLTPSVTYRGNNIVVKDLADNTSLLKIDDFKTTISIPEKPYYTNPSDITSNIPNKYYFKSKVSAVRSKAAGYSLIAPPSIIYGLAPAYIGSHDIDLEFSTSAKKLEPAEIIKNMTILTNKFKGEVDAYRFDSKIDYKGAIVKNNIDINAKIINTIHPKNNFIEHFTSIVRNSIIEIINNPTNRMVRLHDNKILDRIIERLNDRQSINKLNNPKAIKFNFDFSAKGKKNKIALNIKELSLMIDSTGIRVSNKTDFDSLIKWFTEGTLVMYQYDEIIPLIIEMQNLASKQQIGLTSVAVKKKTISEFLRFISNHPQAQTNDAYIDYSLSSENNMGKIGSDYTIIQVGELYFKLLAQNALAAVNKKNDISSELKKILPEYKNQPNILNNIKNNFK